MDDVWPDRLDICFNVVNDARELDFAARGKRALDAREAILAEWAASRAQRRESAISRWT